MSLRWMPLWSFRPRRPYRLWWRWVAWRVETYTRLPVSEIRWKTLVGLVKQKDMRHAFMRYLRWVQENKQMRSRTTMYAVRLINEVPAEILPYRSTHPHIYAAWKDALVEPYGQPLAGTIEDYNANVRRHVSVALAGRTACCVVRLDEFAEALDWSRVPKYPSNTGVQSGPTSVSVALGY